MSNLVEKIDRLGRKTVFVYDGLNRNTQEKWYDDTTLLRTIEFEFDANSRLTEATDVAATYGFTYDALSRVISETQSFAGFSPLLSYDREFNSAGSVTEIAATIGSTADFLNTLTYDNLQRVTRIEQDENGGNAVAEKRADLAYDASGALGTITRYADLAGSELVVTTSYGYDGIGRLLSLLHEQDTTTLAGYDFAYDAASRITSIDSYVDGLTEYDHDNTSQLIAADHTGQTDESYSFDENGNRTMSGYDIDPNNQLASDGVYNYTYDAEGNRLTKTNISTGDKEEYTWDHRNRLVTVTFKNSSGTVIKTVDQLYDVFNQWIRRRVDPDGATGSAALVDTYFSHLDGQIVAEFDGSSASDLTHRYLFNPAAIDQIMADEAVSSLSSAGSVLYPLADHLGTTRDLASYNATTTTTTIESHRRFDAFGIMVSQTNSNFQILFGFTGRPYDASIGLQYNLNRWYAFGTWISEDPIGFHGDISNLNRYVSNDPLVYIDSDGLRKKKEKKPDKESRPKGWQPDIPTQTHNAPLWDFYDLGHDSIGIYNPAVPGPCTTAHTRYFTQISSNNWDEVIKALEKYVEQYGKIDDIGIIDHGSTEGQAFGPYWKHLSLDDLARLAPLLEEGATLTFWGCSVGTHPGYCQDAANVTGATVAANSAIICHGNPFKYLSSNSLSPYGYSSYGTWKYFYPEEDAK